MFKVFKSKEVIDSNFNNSDKNNRNDILDDFKNYQNNVSTNNFQFNNNIPSSNMIINGNVNTNSGNRMYGNINNNPNFFDNNINIPNNQINMNSMTNSNNQQYVNVTPKNFNEVRTIDINQNIIDAQKLREKHQNSYQANVDAANGHAHIDFSNDNTINSVEYKYNEEIKKHNKLDNIKNIIDSGTNDDNSIVNESVSFNNNMYQNPFQPTYQVPYQNPFQPTYQVPYQNSFQPLQRSNPYPPQQQFYMNQNPFNAQIPIQKEENNENVSLLQNQDRQLLKTDLFHVDEEGFRRCPRCGQKLRGDYRQCFVCGTWLD